ncbi:MAG: glycosyltransferase family 4 protein [Chthoniobacteraceae bacterium]
MPIPAGNKLRIAQVAPLWTPIPPSTYGGIELLLALLCDELVARGHDVTLFASGDCRTAAKLREIIPVNLSELMSRGDALMYEYYMNAAMAAVLAAQDEFDIVHCHLPPAWLPFAAAMRTPCTFTLHTSPHADDEWALKNFPRAQAVAISHAQVAAASSRLGRKFTVVFNGVDFARYDASFKSGKSLGFLGRMSREKNPLGAIRIAQAADLPIVLAGKPQNAAEEAYFRNEVQPLIDGERVRWLGPVNHEQKVALLRDAAALIFPIQWDEPFGLVMIEAMACGTPVLAVRRGSVAEVVDEGVTGFTAPAPAELAPLVAKARALDRHKVRAQAESRFSHTKMVDDYLAHYRALIGSR